MAKNPKRDPRVTEYIDACLPFARPILKHLRKVVHEGCPDAEEAIKWGMPSFLYNGKILCGVAGFKAHCALWFWEGSDVVKDKNNKAGEAMGNFGRITSKKDLPSDAAIKKYIKLAMKMNEAELAKKAKKAAKKKAPKKGK